MKIPKENDTLSKELHAGERPEGGRHSQTGFPHACRVLFLRAFTFGAIAISLRSEKLPTRKLSAMLPTLTFKITTTANHNVPSEITNGAIPEAFERLVFALWPRRRKSRIVISGTPPAIFSSAGLPRYLRLRQSKTGNRRACGLQPRLRSRRSLTLSLSYVHTK